VPTLKRLSRSKICLYAGDHLPPHFHIRANDAREALEWAQNNRDALYEEWMRLNND